MAVARPLIWPGWWMVANWQHNNIESVVLINDLKPTRTASQNWSRRTLLSLIRGRLTPKASDHFSGNGLGKRTLRDGKRHRLLLVREVIPISRRATN
jgi:hypothetical protein